MMDLLSIAFGLVIASLLLIVYAQSQQIKFLKGQLAKRLPQMDAQELEAQAAEKLETVGPIKAVKFLQEEYGMSMVDAKKLVDSVKH